MKKKEENVDKNKTGKKESELVTKESLSAVCAIFSLVALFILCTRSFIFGEIGVGIHSFLTGVFGYMAYPILLGALYLSVTSLIGKRLVKNRKAGAFVILTVIMLALLVHTATSTFPWDEKKVEYIANCFKAGESFPAVTAFGWVGALIVFVVSSATTNIGAIIIFSVLSLFFGYLTVVAVKNPPKEKEEGKKKTESAPVDYAGPVEIPLSQPNNVQAQAQAQPQTQSSVQPTPVYAAPTYSAEQPQTSAYNGQQYPQNGYGYGAGNTTPQKPYMGEVMTQRPGVLLSDENINSRQATQEAESKGAGMGAFSPFGSPLSMRRAEEADWQNSYEKSREFLFGSTPAENYRRNLIFDPNANVNKRPSVESYSPQFGGGYTPSYSEAYQSSMNTDVSDKPTKIFTDRSQEPVSRGYEQQKEQPIAPMRPMFEQPMQPQQSVSYPKFETPVTPVQPIQSVQSQPIEPTPSYTPNEVRLETEKTELSGGRNEESIDYRRHDYMDLFSPSNPNVFGDRSEDRELAQETFSQRDVVRDSFDDRAKREETPVRGEENELPFRGERDVFEERTNDRRGIDIFDESEELDDPYSLRSDFGDSRGGRENFELPPERLEESRDSRDSSSRIGERFSSDLTETRTGMGTRFEEVGNRMEEPTRVAPEIKPEEPKPTPPSPPKPRVIRPYVRPHLDDFDCRDVEPSQNFEEVEEAKANIIATLEDFKVTGAAIASVTFGPTVTRYNVTIPRNISPKKVVALDQSIAISLHSSGVNIYPNYEDGVVSIEVPNKERQFVQLGCMLSGDTFINSKPSSLMFAMGKDVGNRKVYGDICKMTHLLVAGSSNSGKSVFLGALILSLIYKYSPDELRLILIDPKKTEFVLYNDLPHLMINEIITDVNKTVQSLNWAIGEMNRRYGLFEQMSRAGTYVVNLDQYNAHLKKEERLPKIVIIIDELADLMLAAKKDIEDRIQNLTQKARAAGIHLIVATQRPSADVITGVIKSNLSTRIAFMVASDVDSRVILDQTGAQKLLGKGDFLYTMPGINTPVRVQSAFSAPEESQRVVDFIKMNNEAYYDESATAFINNARGGSEGDSYGRGDEVEPVYIDALRFVILSGSASISMIQRKCSVGYNKAGKIVEWMEDMGYISSFDGAKARKVLITKEEFESKYGSL